MLKHFYSLVMDDNRNAFRALPKIVRFQLMTVLAYMWSAIFSAGIGSYFIFGTSVIFHTLFLLGIFFTADLFNKARNTEINIDHRAKFRDKEEGGALYDDLWGGI